MTGAGRPHTNLKKEKKTVKKILIATVMAALLCTTLTACGDDDCEGAGTLGGVTLMSMTDGKSGGSSGGKGRSSGSGSKSGGSKKSASSGGSSSGKSDGKKSSGKKAKSHDDDCDED